MPCKAVGSESKRYRGLDSPNGQDRTAQVVKILVNGLFLDPPKLWSTFGGGGGG